MAFSEFRFFGTSLLASKKGEMDHRVGERRGAWMFIRCMVSKEFGCTLERRHGLLTNIQALAKYSKRHVLMLAGGPKRKEIYGYDMQVKTNRWNIATAVNSTGPCKKKMTKYIYQIPI